MFHVDDACAGDLSELDLAASDKPAAPTALTGLAVLAIDNEPRISTACASCWKAGLQKRPTAATRAEAAAAFPGEPRLAH